MDLGDRPEEPGGGGGEPKPKKGKKDDSNSDLISEVSSASSSSDSGEAQFPDDVLIETGSSIEIDDSVMKIKIPSNADKRLNMLKAKARNKKRKPKDVLMKSESKIETVNLDSKSTEDPQTDDALTDDPLIEDSVLDLDTGTESISWAESEIPKQNPKQNPKDVLIEKSVKQDTVSSVKTDSLIDTNKVRLPKSI